MPNIYWKPTMYQGFDRYIQCIALYNPHRLEKLGTIFPQNQSLQLMYLSRSRTYQNIILGCG